MGLWDELKKGVETFKQRSREATDYAKLRLDKASLQREQADLLRRLGREVYTLHRQGMPLPDVLTPLLQRLARLGAEIGSKQEALRRSALETGGTVSQDVPPLETKADG